MLIKNSDSVLLPDYIIDFAKKIGINRQSKSRYLGIRDLRFSKFDPLFIDQNGAAGEIAFLIMLLNKEIIDFNEFKENLDKIKDTSPKSSKLGTDLGDIKLKNGYTIDVKTTNYMKGNLIIPEYKLNNSAVSHYVLIKGDIKKYIYYFGGIINTNDIKHVECEIKTNNGKKSYWLKDDLLNNINQGNNNLTMSTLIQDRNLWL